MLLKFPRAKVDDGAEAPTPAVLVPELRGRGRSRLIVAVALFASMAWLALAAFYVAEYIGWQAGSPFQVELGFANLGRALLGILSIQFRGTFWVAPVVTNSVFGLGAAFVHLREIFEHSNYSPGNAGPVLFLDIVVPVVAIALLVGYLRERSRESEA